MPTMCCHWLHRKCLVAAAVAAAAALLGIDASSSSSLPSLSSSSSFSSSLFRYQSSLSACAFVTPDAVMPVPRLVPIVVPTFSDGAVSPIFEADGRFGRTPRCSKRRGTVLLHSSRIVVLPCRRGTHPRHRNHHYNCRRRAVRPLAAVASSSSAAAAAAAAVAAAASSATVVISSTVDSAYAHASSLVSASVTRGVGSQYLVRILFLRGLAFVYGAAFLVAYRQNRALIGDYGITPARRVLDDAEERGRSKREKRDKWLDERENYRYGGTTAAAAATTTTAAAAATPPRRWWDLDVIRTVRHWLDRSEWYKNIREVLWDRSDRMDRPVTTLLWLAKDRSKLNTWLDGVALVGLTLALAMFLLGSANVPLLLILWICQRSLMAVGGTWYGYGWEPQLAELGFHALFLVPFLSLDPLAMPVPMIPIWAIRWHLYRIMMGAGLIKLKSNDAKWKYPSLSAMDCFYETQPVPNPLTKFFHAAPKWWHKLEVLTNHFVELITPWLLIVPGLPRRYRIVGGLIQLVFQGVLILSGNLSFLNWLTALPALFCLDDASLSKLFAPSRTTSTSVAAYTHLAAGTGVGAGVSPIRQIVNILFGTLIVRLSIPVVKNLLAKRQLMNASFDPLRLINTYGAFGVVCENRDELIVQSTNEFMEGEWREYEFKVKPGNVFRSPRFISPYHYRLDWQMWIASQAGGVERSPWLYSFLLKLLQQDKEVTGLLAKDPWAVSVNDGDASDDAANAETATVEASERGKNARPKYIRIEKYRYKFNYDKATDGNKRPYWKREYVGRYFPRQGIMTEDMLADYIQ